MTRGRAALLRVLRRTKVEYVAARCRVTPNAVYDWMSGRRKPSDGARSALAVNYGITPETWDEPQVSTGPQTG